MRAGIPFPPATMGLFVSKFSSYFNLSKDCRILMVGLDAAGKSTLLYQFKLGETVTTIPTIGFNVETVDCGKLHMTIWDVGGQDRIRPLWRHYFQGTQGMIFVIDLSDGERAEEAAMELEKVLSDPSMGAVPVLIFANKSDMPQRLTVSQLSARMDLPALLGRRKWLVQESVATTGQGLHEGIGWLSNALQSS